MRFFPSPYEGLHPAFPNSPSPAYASPLYVAFPIASIAGVVGTAVGAVVRGRPAWGLAWAAWTMVGTAGAMAHEDTGRNRMCSKSLETQGIKVPSIPHGS